MVMAAVNTVLGGGLHVGVVLEGKKIRDDNKTLLQTGISHDNKMDTLGFTIEASPARYSLIRKSRLLFGNEGTNFIFMYE